MGTYFVEVCICTLKTVFKRNKKHFIQYNMIKMLLKLIFDITIDDFVV